MKVAFWNGTGLVANVTGYLAAISAYCAIYYGKSVYVSRNHFSNRKLEDYFFSDSTKSGKEKVLECYSYGEPEYFRKLWEEDRQKHRDIITFEGIRLLGPPDILDRFMFYCEVQADALYCMDIPKGVNASSAQALEEADVVAVFLPQNKAEIHKFFDRYSSIIPKSVFFIANYHKAEECGPGYLRKIFGIEKGKIETLPYSEVFELACETGEVESFFRSNEIVGGKPEKQFRQQIRKAAEMILASEVKE